MKYSSYPEYAEAAPDWLGTLPRHWSSRRLRFAAAEPLMYGANEAAILDDHALPRYIRITDVKADGTLHDDTFRSLDEVVAAPYLLQDGDILLARSGATVGKSFQYLASWGRAAYAGYLIRCRPDKNIIFPRFANYYFQTECYWACIRSTLIQATIENFSAEKYKDLTLPLPTKGEQQQIAAFLDWKTWQIDALMGKKKELLEKLKEKRIAVITHAVTQGLNPAAPMRDSGTPWLGQVPKHWEIKRLRYCTGLVTSGSRGWAQHFSDFGELFLRITNLDRESIELLLEDTQRVEPPDGAEGARTLTEPGDLLISITADLGSVAVIPPTLEPAYVSQHISLVRLDTTTIDPNWIAYSIFSHTGKFQLRMAGYGGTKVQLSLGDIKEIGFCHPPTLEEQQGILDFIRAQTKRTEDLIDLASGVIDRLTEYRTALITAATTGKIDVRNVKIPVFG